jgi:hypothetical protein
MHTYNRESIFLINKFRPNVRITLAPFFNEITQEGKIYKYCMQHNSVCHQDMVLKSSALTSAITRFLSVFPLIMGNIERQSSCIGTTRTHCRLTIKERQVDAALPNIYSK